MAATILIVDDETDIRELIGEILADEDYRPVLAADAEQARKARREHRPDLILLDVWMPDCDGISLLREWKAEDEIEQGDCPVIMISGHASVETAVEATREGAFDFIEKPLSMARLLSTVRAALTQRTSPASMSSSTAVEPAALPEPIGRSEATVELRRRLQRITQSSEHVLICGEAGSGRTTLARLLQARSAGNGASEETVCGRGGNLRIRLEQWAEPDSDRPRSLILERFDALAGDEAAALENLLAAAGDTMRVIAVARPGLDTSAAAETFPQALYHRIAQSRIDLSPLRERREDIPDLVRHLTEQLPLHEGLTWRPISVAAQNRLRQHEWPGNLHELVNLLRRLLDRADEQPVEVEEVDQQLPGSAPNTEHLINQIHSPLFELPLREAREAFERSYLSARLSRVEGSVGQLAEAVGMERTHLYRKLRQLGIDPKQF